MYVIAAHGLALRVSQAATTSELISAIKHDSLHSSTAAVKAHLTAPAKAGSLLSVSRHFARAHAPLTVDQFSKPRTNLRSTELSAIATYTEIVYSTSWLRRRALQNRDMALARSGVEGQCFGKLVVGVALELLKLRLRSYDCQQRHCLRSRSTDQRFEEHARPVW